MKYFNNMSKQKRYEAALYAVAILVIASMVVAFASLGSV